ncbi:MAG: hypothetical protein EPN70_13835 [Paraburkholderia sp.]|uniref:hypothetical protein n=1 Tax=Paraburkholderia sp. TaxID=1926495 RepID=UPI0012055B04|nr:hypothetical protein [Paraburkholderia sp.]TAM03562.1 MAG: hypothetical protein EPN70_13835 [Paraburkholderia sp.]TAM32156.1 MAG: hypothetical protein EPN59_02130 [Paraburkholderia sp.]
MTASLRTPQRVARAAALALAVAAVALSTPGVPVAFADEPVGNTTDAPAKVDLFPAQRWDALGELAATEIPEMPAQIDPNEFGGADAVAPEPEPEPPAAPFAVTGEWREGGRRVVVVEAALEAGPELRLLCERRCDVRGAVGPGDEIAPGYRLKRLTDREALIVDANGDEFSLPTPGLTP